MATSTDLRSAIEEVQGQLPEDGQLAGEGEILASEGRTLAQGALAWIWGRSDRTIPIPGFKNVQQAEENARAMTFGPLTPEQMAEIDALLGK